MARSRTPRKDLDDEPSPQWVTEPEKQVPKCNRCGVEVPGASALRTLCGNCQGLMCDGAKPTGPGRKPGQSTLDVIRALAHTLAPAHARGLVEQHGRPAADSRVRFHAERLVKRGVDESTAYRQAASMVADPVHLETCPHCQGAPPS